MEARLQKHTLFLYPGDYRKVSEHYPQNGAAHVIRLLVRKLVKEIEEKSQLPNVEELEKFEGEI